jgi:hypothetical protein
MANEKTFSAKEAALAILAKAQELLGKSSVVKTEEPAKVAECQSGMHTVGYYSAQPFEKSETLDCGFEPFQKAEMDKHGLSPDQMKAKLNKDGMSPKEIKAKMNKSNPDEKQDAQLGEKVEHLCEDHMIENKGAERKEGHKLVQKSECAKCSSGMQKSEFSDLYSDLEKMEKAENKTAPSDPMKPKSEEKPVERDNKNFETQPEGSNTPPDARQAPQTPPQANPAENKEGNNPPAGAVPGKGVHKLSFFMGHQHHKKTMKKGIALS